VANVVPNSPILVTLMMEALRSSEMSIFRRAMWCNIPEDGIFICNIFIKINTAALHNLQVHNLHGCSPAFPPNPALDKLDCKTIHHQWQNIGLLSSPFYNYPQQLL
jgi:hypothetical protein